MKSERPVVFLRTKILEATPENLVLKIPRGLPSWWMLVFSVACACAAPAVLLSMKAGDAPTGWVIGVAFVGGGITMLPWAWMQGIAFGWCRLAPVHGRLALRRSVQGDFSLQIAKEAEEQSAQRGLYYLDYLGINTLVLVVGQRLASVAYFLKTGASGIDWSFGEWDKGRAELGRGAHVLENTWPPRSVVPLVHAILQVLNPGPQPLIEGEAWPGCKTSLVFFFGMFALPLSHVAALCWLEGHANLLDGLGPSPGGLLVAAVLLLPHAWFFYRHMKRVWIDPLNLKAEEMVALSSDLPLQGE